MLFDLRGRGRRNTVRVLYIGLAVLLGVGLVGFGVGGGFGGGGLFDAASSNEGAGGASFASKIEKYEKVTKREPSNAAAWESLSKNLLHEAGNEGYVNPETGAPTAKGKELYRRASQAWLSYLALNPPKPNPELAQLVYVVYSEAGLNEPDKAVQALNYVVQRRPTASYYAQLAEFAYKANKPGLGDLASAKAVALAPASDRVRVKKELEEVRRFPHGGQTYVTTTNGKTYRLKKAPNGSFTTVSSPTTPPPASSSTTTTTGK